ncbi:MAG: hypothetical protein AB1650_03540 [Candidatus Omnitrophota bacterium]
MKKMCIAVALFFLSSSSLFASGWNDYVLDIGDGYSVFRANTLDISISKGGLLVFNPRDFGGVGPVENYQMRDRFILLKTKGRKDRNLFEGDTFQNVDYETEYYFVLRKTDDSVLGPFNEAQFEKRLADLNIATGEWIKPENPHPYVARRGQLLFLIFAIIVVIPLLAIRYFYISIPLIAVVFWLVKRIKKKNIHLPQERISP